VRTYPAPEGVDVVKLVSDEVTTVCPVLGNPDFYEVTIRYAPRGRILCTKSLKHWFVSQRQEGYAAETFCRAVLRSVFEAVGPHWLEVTVLQKPRGGISIEASGSLP
jgi:7-cyano-7-deazaguanine reductase